MKSNKKDSHHTVNNCLIFVVGYVVVYRETLAICQQCIPLPTRRYNHGEVASTVIELCYALQTQSLQYRAALQTQSLLY